MAACKSREGCTLGTYSKPELVGIFIAAADRYGIRRDVMYSQITQESGWCQCAYSADTLKSGRVVHGRGLAQFIEETGARYGLHTVADFYDPYKNSDAWGWYLSDMLKKYGNYADALYHYNGSGSRALAYSNTVLGKSNLLTAANNVGKYEPVTEAGFGGGTLIFIGLLALGFIAMHGKG